MRTRVVLAALAAMVAGAMPAAAAPSAEQVRQLSAGGLAVVVGEASPDLPMAVADGGRWLVLQLVSDETQREAARKRLAEASLQPFVRVEVLPTDKRIPLANEMATAVVVVGGAVAQAEALRVLTPQRGRAWIDGREHTKPMPAHYGEWTHWAANAQGTKTNPETGMQIPNAVRWIAGPWYGDGINPNAWRLSGGLAAAEWNLVGFKEKQSVLNVEVRDAFNGVPQWRHAHHAGAESHKTRPFVMVDGIILRPDETVAGHPFAAFDAASGAKLRVFEGMPTAEARSGRPLNFGMVAGGGRMYQCGPDAASKPLARCVEIATGKVLWTHTPDKNFVRPTLAGDVVVFVQEGEYPRPLSLWRGRYPNAVADRMVALKVADGAVAWQSEIDPRMHDLRLVEPGLDANDKAGWWKSRFHQIAYVDGRLFCLFACDANGGNPAAIWGLDARTGKSLWVSPCGPAGSGAREMFDLHVLKDGTLLTYGHAWARFDPATGKLIGHGSIGGNGRCDTGSATADLVTAGFNNYFKLEGEQLLRTRRDIIRSECGGYTTPGYGMTFGQSSGCGCLQPIRGLTALHHMSLPEPIADEQRLTKGPAYGQPLAAAAKADEWPVFLANNLRHTSNASTVPAEPKEKWSVKLGEPLGPKADGVKLDWRVACFNNGPITAPVVAGGLVVVAQRDEHAVVALDADTGQQKWRFIADGRLMNPPTIYKGRVIFGTRGGRVWNLELSTGALAWSFLAAPEHRYILGYGQIESAWPLHGSLTVSDDIIVASAGFHGETDGGVFAWGLDAATGRIVWKQRIYREPRAWIEAGAKGNGEPAGDRWFNPNQSNGRYNVTRVNNMELPTLAGGIAGAAMQFLDLKTGAPADRPNAAQFLYEELYPFFNFRLEHRGGPHGSGNWSAVIDGRNIGDYRGPGETSRWAFADGRFYTNWPSPERGARGNNHVFAVNPAEAPARTRNVNEFGKSLGEIPGAAADALVVAGDRVVLAGEAEAPTDYVLPVKGWMQVTPIVGGKTTVLALNAAIINSGLAAASGRIYASCQDGTVRCFAE